MLAANGLLLSIAAVYMGETTDRINVSVHSTRLVGREQRVQNRVAGHRTSVHSMGAVVLLDNASVIGASYDSHVEVVKKRRNAKSLPSN
jgi:hypothetical protein